MADYVKAGQSMTANWANDVVSELRGIRKITNRRTVVLGNRSGGTTACPFGRIITKKVDDVPKKFIQGGVVYAGDKNFNVEDYEIPDFDGERLMYFSVSVTVNMDDDAEILLPNVRTSSWSPSWSYTSGSSYPDNDNPTVPSGDGTIIIPLGVLSGTYEGGDVYTKTFTATGCGNVNISHCAGTLTHTRS